MKTAQLLCILCFLLTYTSVFSNKIKTDQTVNSLIGDVSFTSKFGFAPNQQTDEVLRIQTHLEYVENLLQSTEITNLNDKQLKNRKQLINFLHKYWTEGVFPANYSYPNTRVSCFIDKNDRICALGYLIEQTAGRETAEQINSKFQYEKVMDMKDPILEDWIAQSGLTKEECAMIQPTYDYQPIIVTEPINFSWVAATPAVIVDTKSIKELEKTKKELKLKNRELDSLKTHLAKMDEKMSKLTNDLKSERAQLKKNQLDNNALMKDLKANNKMHFYLSLLLGIGLLFMILKRFIWKK